MRALSVLILSVLLTSSAFADPRNTSNYRVLFDLEARGKTPIVSGYGAYVQIYDDGSAHWIRYCENFEGTGLGGRPNPLRIREKLLPIGTQDDRAFRCRDFSPGHLSIGQRLIQLGDKYFFAMKSSNWKPREGGEILFQFALKIPLVGHPTYRALRVRADRKAGELDYVVESIVPVSGVFPTEFLTFDVAGTGLGFPNAITGLTLNMGKINTHKVDLDILENGVPILGYGKGAFQH